MIGRNGPHDGIHDRLAKALAVIDLDEVQPNAPTANPVGKFQIYHRTHPEDESLSDVSGRRQQITIEISGNGFRDFLTGTVAMAQRAGYVKIDFPPNEQWQPVLERLPTHVPARIETPEFYQAIQQRITRRVCEQANASPATLTNSS